MRTLVTGAAGFLGYHLARALPPEGLVLVDDFRRGEPDAAFRRLLTRPGVEFLRGDLCDPRFVGAIIGEYDAVYHLAALNGTTNFYARPWDTLRCAALPTINLLEALVRTGRCRRFIYAGSSETYAGAVLRCGWPVPTAEDAPLVVADLDNPRWSYAAGKGLGEAAVVNACRGTRCEWTVLRYHNVYGPRMGEDGHFIPEFLRRALRGEFLVYGPEQSRAFMYINDAVAATIALAALPEAMNQVLNVGDGTEWNIKEVAHMMMRILDTDECELKTRPASPGSVDRRVPDLGKLDHALPRRPRTMMADGLWRTVAYYRDGVLA